MINDIVGLVAESRAGHDKGKKYIIVAAQNDYAWIADGKTRTVEKPKRKNLKHLSITKKENFLNNKTVSNEEIKFVLERFKCLCQNQI